MEVEYLGVSLFIYAIYTDVFKFSCDRQLLVTWEVPGI